MALSLLVPTLYVVVLFGSLYIFSVQYRKRTAATLIEPYFPSHPERNAYVTLLGRTDPPASDALIKSALVRRAIGDVQRVLRVREDKPALQALLQKGSIGEELWNSLLAAEKELEAEIMEVVAEANTFVDGWGSIIFQTANEMIANEKLRSTFEATDLVRAEKQARYNYTLTYKAITPASPTPAPTTPLPTPLALPQTPVRSDTLNGLVPPPSAGTESAMSTDNEAPKTPSKSSNNKKRK